MKRALAVLAWLASAGSAPEGSAAEAMPGMQMPPSTPGAGNAGAEHREADTPEEDVFVPETPPPPPPKDRAAERYYDPKAMQASYEELQKEHGGDLVSKIMVNLAQYQARSSGGGYRWDGEARYGGDLNRFVAKSEGDGGKTDGLDTAEIQALYSRAVGPYTDLQVGLRQDFGTTSSRTYAALSAETLLPYWFEVQASAFVSTKGELLARLEGTYDLFIAQRIVLQPRVELNFAAQNSPQIALGSGLSNAELGLRVRYDLSRTFSPYVGVSYDAKNGTTADIARARGRDTSATSLVIGLRTFF